MAIEIVGLTSQVSKTDWKSMISVRFLLAFNVNAKCWWDEVLTITL